MPEMPNQDAIFIGSSYHGKNNELQKEYIWLQYANRHGFITGATGTGKTVSVQVLAEAFSRQGVPVFCADVKGDLSGISKAGTLNEKIQSRMHDVGIDDLPMQGSPVIFWDLFGEEGHPIRTTIAEMGPLLLSRILELTPAQEGILNIAFRYAADQNLLLLNLKDLQSMMTHVADKAVELSARYGNVTKQSVGAIQRQLLVLNQQGGAKFFGEPALQLTDIMRVDQNGRGLVSLLAAEKLMDNPRLYSTFLLWLMSELFEKLPEIGDPEKPKLVFIFDEAHLLFDNAPKALIDRIEQVVRLIRSKGVGVYFCTQNPLDMPETVLSQLSNRIQHALRAYTPRETQAVKVAASTFRPNPDFDTTEAIKNLSTGQALVSTLQEKGVPSIVQITTIKPPSSQIGAITAAEREQLRALSPIAGVYEAERDRDSAFEMLTRASEQKPEPQQGAQKTEQENGFWGKIFGANSGNRARQSVGEAVVKSVTRSAANSLGRFVITLGENYLRQRFGKSNKKK